MDPSDFGILKVAKEKCCICKCNLDNQNAYYYMPTMENFCEKCGEVQLGYIIKEVEYLKDRIKRED